RAWFGSEGRDMGASLSRREVAAERGGSYSPVAGPANGGGGWTGRGQALESPQARGLTNRRHSAHVPALRTLAPARTRDPHQSGAARTQPLRRTSWRRGDRRSGRADDARRNPRDGALLPADHEAPLPSGSRRAREPERRDG